MTIRPRLLIALLCALEAGAAFAAPAFWPARMEGDRIVRTTPLPDCRVVAVTGDGQETIHHCGLPVSLPARAVFLWIEQGNAISGQISPPIDSAAVDLPLVGAGSVVVEQPPEASGGPRHIVRLFHAGGVRFTRTIPRRAGAEPVRMPAGTALSLRIDPRGDVVDFDVANVVTGRTTAMRPAFPVQGAALVGIFTLPANGATPDPASFFIDGGSAAPLVVDRGNEVIALWRTLPAGPAELTLRSAVYHSSPTKLRLRERHVATIRAELRPLPTLTVKIHVPESALPAWKSLAPSLIIRRAADKEVVKQGDAMGEEEFSRLPLDVYDAVLTVKPWTFARRADLTDGIDEVVDFTLEPFEISGRVTAGDEPKAATLTFQRGKRRWDERAQRCEWRICGHTVDAGHVHRGNRPR